MKYLKKKWKMLKCKNRLPQITKSVKTVRANDDIAKINKFLLRYICIMLLTKSTKYNRDR